MAAFHIDSECVNSTDLPYAFDIAGLPISVNGNTICRGKNGNKNAIESNTSEIDDRLDARHICGDTSI